MAKSGKNSQPRKSLIDDNLHTELASLQNMTHPELKLLWLGTFQTPAPHNLSRRLMVHALAYQMQVHAYGGLNKAIKRELLEKATPSQRRSGVDAHKAVSPVKLSPGTRLMREWHGVVHVVDRTADGFLWNGRTFRSLSAIARAITGARWNGLAFFGLRKKQIITPEPVVEQTPQQLSSDPEVSPDVSTPSDDHAHKLEVAA